MSPRAAIAIIVALTLLAMGLYADHLSRTLHAERIARQTALDDLADERAARAKERKAEEIGEAVVVKYEAAKETVRTVYRTIKEEVPVYVTRESDSRCVVPIGAVRLLNAAAAGQVPVSDPAGQPNDAPSGLNLSEVTATVADNYGTYHAVAAQLVALQSWVVQQRALDEAR